MAAAPTDPSAEAASAGDTPRSVSSGATWAMAPLAAPAARNMQTASIQNRGARSARADDRPGCCDAATGARRSPGVSGMNSHKAALATTSRTSARPR